VCTVARDRDHDLFEKGLDVSVGKLGGRRSREGLGGFGIQTNEAAQSSVHYLWDIPCWKRRLYIGSRYQRARPSHWTQRPNLGRHRGLPNFHGIRLISLPLKVKLRHYRRVRYGVASWALPSGRGRHSSISMNGN
jgi:hypothetical protein